MSDPGTDQAPFAMQVVAVRRSLWSMGLAALPLLLCLRAYVGEGTDSDWQLLPVIEGLAIGAPTMYLAWRHNPWPRLSRTKLRVDDESLFIGDKRYARADIRAGFIVPGDEHVTVRLERKGLRSALEVRAASEKKARALLRALGLAATQSMASFRAMSRVFVSKLRTAGIALATVACGAMVAGTVAELYGSDAGFAAMLLPVLVLVGLMLAPTRVDVGIDGVLMCWLGRKRFFAHDDIRDVRTTSGAWERNHNMVVELTLASGEEVVIPTGNPAYNSGHAASLEARIRAAGRSWAEGKSAHSEALLRRGARSHRQWVAALKDPHAGASHRRAAVAPQTLWRIVEDPTGSSLERAAAAVALKRELDARGRSRLARAAAATVAPRLRIALDAVSEDADEEVLAEALAELEAEEETNRRAPV